MPTSRVHSDPGGIVSISRRRTRRRGYATLSAAVVGAATVLSACAASLSAPQPTATASVPTVIARPSAPQGEVPAALADQLTAIMADTMTEFGVPGAGAGVWIPGQGSWTAVAGLADVESGDPVTEGMQWPLRSVTKSYTVTLILQLVEEGLISLDDTIDQHVDGVTDGDSITLRELANMSSGNADYTNSAFVADPDRIFTLEELNGFMLGEPARFAPGTERIYTNANTNLLGAVVEDVTGQSFGDAVTERILRPLGQTGTEYIIDPSKWSADHALGYFLAENGDGWEVQPDNLSVFGPAGSMFSTLEDGRAWADVLGSGALLTPATQAERLKGGPLEEGPPYDLYALGIGDTDGWWGHNGEGFGYTSAVFHHPGTGVSIVVFTNLSNIPSGEHPADQMFRRFAAVIEKGSP